MITPDASITQVLSALGKIEGKLEHIAMATNELQTLSREFIRANATQTANIAEHHARLEELETTAFAQAEDINSAKGAARATTWGAGIVGTAVAFWEFWKSINHPH